MVRENVSLNILATETKQSRKTFLCMPFSTLQPRGVSQTALLLKTLPWLSLPKLLGLMSNTCTLLHLSHPLLPQALAGPPELLADPTQSTQHCTSEPFYICAPDLKRPPSSSAARTLLNLQN